MPLPKFWILTYWDRSELRIIQKRFNLVADLLKYAEEQLVTQQKFWIESFNGN